MKTQMPIHIPRLAGAGLLAVAILASAGPKTLSAQAPPDPAHAAHVASGAMPPDPVKGDSALSQQISQLQAKVARLETALAQTASPMAGTPASAAMGGMPAAAPVPGPAMGMGMDKMKSGAPMPGMSPGAPPAPPMAGMSGAAPPAGGMMGMMSQMMGMMDKMMPMGVAAAPMPAGGGGKGMDEMKMDAMPAAAPATGMSDAGGMMGMMDMMGMSGGGSMAAMPQSALPGFPGASHLYHIGGTGFFLDHPHHITLTTEQQAALNKAKEQALLAKNTADRAVEQSEQGLWALTAADQPDATKIEAKIREVEKLRGDERLAFIRAVGDASKLLTEGQRKILTGFAPVESAAPTAAPMPPGMKGM
jgi:hypothetical protein